MLVKDRQILDGILIAKEEVDEARKSKKKLLLFKMDFKKAYDYVYSGYLDAVIDRMSFPTLWRKWIKKCVCGYHICVSQWEPHRRISFKEGFNTRRPPIPFPFFVCNKGFECDDENHGGA